MSIPPTTQALYAKDTDAIDSTERHSLFMTNEELQHLVLVLEDMVNHLVAKQEQHNTRLDKIEEVLSDEDKDVDPDFG